LGILHRQTQIVLGSKRILFHTILFIVVFQIFHCGFLAGQDTIYLNNPSFEDIPRRGAPNMPPIKGWYDCGISEFPQETPPDIHPVAEPAWQVILNAKDGKTYLGLVTRENMTYESVSQRLDISLSPGRCYTFSAYLVQSDIYKSPTVRTTVTHQLENFIAPTQLLIWGGDSYCGKKELLAKSGPVTNHEWISFQFVLSPKREVATITLEAYYETEISPATNGHVMVDGLSPIIEVDCKN
jgi:hypothetical protein